VGLGLEYVALASINHCLWYVQGFPPIHSMLHFLNNRHEYKTIQNTVKILKTCKKEVTESYAAYLKQQT
jgi:hypothetical protein